jgi:hypothetical protein
MSSLSVWRLICLLAIIGSILQSIGFFFPYALMINTVTGKILEADSYWSFLAHGITAGIGISSLLSLTSSLIALVCILTPFITACVELFRRPQRRSSLTCISISIGLALLGFAELFFMAFGAVLTYSLCVGDDCVLDGDFGSGLLPLCSGFLLSLACFITLLVLWLKWWRHSVPRKMVEYPLHQIKFSDYNQEIERH